MRSALLATLLCLAAAPALAQAPGSHCAASGAKGEELIAVSVPGNFKACIERLLEAAKKKCGAEPELKLTVTGSEFGKAADLRVLRVDCPGDGGKVSRPLPPGVAPKK